MRKVGEHGHTADRILDVAETLVQVRGFNGFSYADVANEVGYTTAALHYHFATKADLGAALISRYSNRFVASLAGIESGPGDAPARLDAYAGLFRRTLSDERMCLCGMMAAEYQTLPESMQRGVVRFFDENEVWLSRVLDQGREQGSLRFSGTPREVARAIIGSLEGAMLMAWPLGDVAGFVTTAARLVADLRAPMSPSSRG